MSYINNIPFYGMIIGVITLIFVSFLFFSIKKKDRGNAKMIEIADAIADGAKAFLTKEYFFLGLFVLLASFLLFIFMNIESAASFLLGAILSGLTGFVGMTTATMTNVRTAQGAAKKGMYEALMIAYNGGSVMGLSVSALGLIGLSLLFIVLGTQYENISALIGFGAGASVVALFSRVAGGIYTKAADVGADLVGKVEAGIPEDDPRNPAVIADNVGDNVGDIAGMGSDIFKSYVNAVLATVLIASSYFQGEGLKIAMLYPLALIAIGTLASLGMTFKMRFLGKIMSPSKALRFSTVGVSAFMIIASFVLSVVLAPFVVDPNYGITSMSFFYSVVIGILLGIAIGLISEYYTSGKPVFKLSHTSKSGAGPNVIAGLALGFESTLYICLLLGASMYVSFYFAGFYGIALSAVGMLSSIGSTISVDAYGPIADNAGGIAEMAGLEPAVREITDELDAIGNTTAAIGKGFAIGSASLTSIALFVAFIYEINISSETGILNPSLLIGLLVGTMLPFLFSAMTMRAVGEAAVAIVEEVRRQFKTIPGIMEGTAKPDYKTCVGISTQAALKKMIAPGLIAILVPFVFGFALKDFDGALLLAGVILGASLSGIFLGLFMVNAGGAWDNAKKFISSGKIAGEKKGSESYKSAVIGDTVGDPFKDTSGPSLNILVNLMAIVALLIARFL